MFDLNEDPGEGNLNLRAYVAALVGPRRIAHGRRTVYQLNATNGQLLVKHPGRGVECFYVEVWLPQQTAGVVNVLFSADQDAIGETGDLVQLFNGPPPKRYSAVILPGENLYAQLATVPAPPAPLVSVVVSQVVF